MGLFSPKKTIKVASTVYNMAGDENDRPDFLKATLFSAVMSPYDKYLGEVIVGNYLTGPGINQRSFFNWAVRNDFAGLPDFSVRNSYAVDPLIVKAQILVPALPLGLETEVQTAFVTDADFTYFAEQYILQNSPELANTEWAAEYDALTETIIIQYVGGATDVIPGGDYDATAQYVISHFYQQVPSTIEPLIPGVPVIGETNAALLPDLAGYTQDSLVNTGVVNHTLNTTTTVQKVYSSGAPTTTTVTPNIDVVPFNPSVAMNTQTVYTGGIVSGGVETESIETFIEITEYRHIVTDSVVTIVVNDLGGGDTETVTTTVAGDYLRPIFDHQTDTQVTTFSKVEGGAQLFIYKIGTGNIALDGLQQITTGAGAPEYFPFIPVRLDNKSITEPEYETSGLYPSCVTAYRRATKGQRFSALVDQVEDNTELSEIDYAYVVYGVSLNVKENACRKYMYQFFKDLIPFQNTTGSYMASFEAGVGNYNAAKAQLDAWTLAQNIGPSDPLFGTPRPDLPSLAPPETTTIRLNTDNTQTKDFDNRITWVSIHEEQFTGLGKPGAKKNTVWMESAGTFDWDEVTGYNDRNGSISTLSSTPNSIEKTYLYYQIDGSNYKRITIHGLIHQNFVYGGKFVQISAQEALDDSDTSGFIIPLHYPTIKAMSLVDTTQMATANTFIVFNSYKIYKKKWYQTFLGMLFIIILVVVAAAIIAPAAVGGAGGLLGGNAALGASFGLSGTAAVVAGAVTNALAAIIVSRAITTVSVELFGEKWGAIIGAIASFAVNFGVAGGFNNFTMSTLLTPQNLLGLSSALANGYAGFVQADIAEMNILGMENAEEYETAMDKLQDMIRDLGGSNDLSFDPMQLTNTDAGNGRGTGSYIPESLDEFIHRTTMTGSDIVEVTLSMVGDYADLNLQLPMS